MEILNNINELKEALTEGLDCGFFDTNHSLLFHKKKEEFSIVRNDRVQGRMNQGYVVSVSSEQLTDLFGEEFYDCDDNMEEAVDTIANWMISQQ
jgi:hypothetical protein